MIRSPVLIIGCPRSGTTLLFNILSEVRTLWSIGYESKDIIERYHHPSTKNWESGVLAAADITATSRKYILSSFERGAASGVFWRRVDQFRDRLRSVPAWASIKRRGQGRQLGAGTSSALPQLGLDTIRAVVRARNTLLPRRSAIRLVEKTPENCLRLPFLLDLFPDASVLYLTRDGRSNVNSLIEGWMQPHLFPGYRVPAQLSIPGYSRDRWAFTLIPGWRDLVARPLEEICAWQWIRCNEAVLAHREGTKGKVPYLTVQYEELVASPATVLPQIAQFLGLDFERDLGHLAQQLPQINAVSTPDRDKWRRRNPEAISRIMPLIAPMMRELRYETGV